MKLTKVGNGAPGKTVHHYTAEILGEKRTHKKKIQKTQQKRARRTYTMINQYKNIIRFTILHFAAIDTV